MKRRLFNIQAAIQPMHFNLKSTSLESTHYWVTKWVKLWTNWNFYFSVSTAFLYEGTWNIKGNQFVPHVLFIFTLGHIHCFIGPINKDEVIIQNALSDELDQNIKLLHVHHAEVRPAVWTHVRPHLLFIPVNRAVCLYVWMSLPRSSWPVAILHYS